MEEGAPTIENVKNLLPLDVLELEIGYGLISLVDEEQGGDLLKRVSMIRRQVALDLGMVLAPIRLRDNVQLATHEYAFKLKGSQIVVGSLLPGCWLAMNPGDAEPGLDGTPTTEPAFGLPAHVDPRRRQGARRDDGLHRGRSRLDHRHAPHRDDPPARRRPAHPPGRARPARRAQGALPGGRRRARPRRARARRGAPRAAVAARRGRRHPRPRVRSSRRSSDKGRLTKDIGLLADYCRQTLARSILRPHLGAGGVLHAITLDGPLEAMLGDAVVQTGDGSYLNLDPGNRQYHPHRVKGRVRTGIPARHAPVVLCSAKVRRHLKQVSEPVLPRLAVISYNEIQRDVDIQMVARVALDGTAGARSEPGTVSA